MQLGQQGPLAGAAIHLSHRGTTYQLVAYTPSARAPAYREAMRRSLLSFATLTDPAMLGVQPAKLEVVNLTEPMTLEGFNTRFPSTVPLEVLETINAAQRQTRFEAGSRLKRVVGGAVP